jgi:hypothetical protein
MKRRLESSTRCEISVEDRRNRPRGEIGGGGGGLKKKEELGLTTGCGPYKGPARGPGDPATTRGAPSDPGTCAGRPGRA